jgi:hypothetical protein
MPGARRHGSFVPHGAAACPKSRHTDLQNAEDRSPVLARILRLVLRWQGADAAEYRLSLADDCDPPGPNAAEG